MVDGSVVTDERLIELYDGAPEAARTLEEFLLNPPQLRRVKASIEPRTVLHELTDCKYQRMIVSTYRVNVDFGEELRHAKESLQPSP
jgi:hypothetical protein